MKILFLIAVCMSLSSCASLIEHHRAGGREVREQSWGRGWDSEPL